MSAPETIPETLPETLRMMPREMRLMSERILSLSALPKGFALMIGDVVMVSQAMGLGGFALLEARLEALKAADPTRLQLTGDRLDAKGEHAWIALHSALDLLGLALAEGREARLEVINMADPAELAVAAGLGPRHGLAVTIDGTALTATATHRADPLLDRLMQQGCAVPAALWWRIFEYAQSALTPDSVVSRRHAGPVIVADDGKIIGRADNDDDTDMSFISSLAPEKA